MIPIDQTLLTLPTAMLLGLMFGLGSCTIACLPYLGPVFMAHGDGIVRSWRIILPFSLGRLSSYCALAGVAGLTGQTLGESIRTLPMNWLMGMAALLIGLAILLRRPERSSCTAHQSSIQVQDLRSETAEAILPSSLFLLGAGMALSPCAPLGSVIFTAASSASAWQGLGLGLAFGIGAIVIPTLLYGIGFAFIGQRLREQLHDKQRYINYLSAGLLILSGTGNLLA